MATFCNCPALRILLLVSLFAGGTATGCPAEANAVDARPLFLRNCSPCHGADAKAGTPMARRLGVKDLTASTLSADKMKSAILEGVKNARGGMPAFNGKLSAEQIDAVVAYVQSLRPAPETGGGAEGG